jgi:DNA-binding NarL/FixJ family response regulator
MLGQLFRTTVANPPPIEDAETHGFEPPPWRAALVAPHGLFRDGFAHLIATEVAEIRLECHDTVEDVAPGAARLALLAFDPSACGGETLRARIEALRARCDGAPIGLVTPDAPAAAGFGALGVTGIVPLSAGAELAVAAVRLMLFGGYCLPPEISLATHPFELAAKVDPSPALEDRGAEDEGAAQQNALTARERDVMRSLRSGHQNKIIAFELGISESTVKVHLRNIMKKLNASNRTQVALGGPLLPRALLSLDRNGARVPPPSDHGDDADPAPAAARPPHPLIDAGVRFPV